MRFNNIYSDSIATFPILSGFDVCSHGFSVHAFQRNILWLNNALLFYQVPVLLEFLLCLLLLWHHKFNFNERIGALLCSYIVLKGANGTNAIFLNIVPESNEFLADISNGTAFVNFGYIFFQTEPVNLFHDAQQNIAVAIVHNCLWRAYIGITFF